VNAWEKNILLVSPSTLLFVVRTVAHLWRQEEQARNVQQIADRGAELYDKFAGFVDDLSKLGARIEQTRNAYDAAFDKLTRGRGNLVRQVEMLRALGVQPTRRLPRQLTQRAEDVEIFENIGAEKLDEGEGIET
jgi:DNA recombination protein RmuC